mmetsp:Transcript_33893/g.97517  ORF Transcript_33893/g.97517 Transcript_33893/m.97517 type:complete len:246 (+) Transcript_33893:261-998(+)
MHDLWQRRRRTRRPNPASGPRNAFAALRRNDSPTAVLVPTVRPCCAASRLQQHRLVRQRALPAQRMIHLQAGAAPHTERLDQSVVHGVAARVKRQRRLRARPASPRKAPLRLIVARLETAPIARNLLGGGPTSRRVRLPHSRRLGARAVADCHAGEDGARLRAAVVVVYVGFPTGGLHIASSRFRDDAVTADDLVRNGTDDAAGRLIRHSWDQASVPSLEKEIPYIGTAHCVRPEQRLRIYAAGD